MNQSEQIDQIATALANANKTIANVERDRTNPHTHSNYATLAAVLAVVRPPLAENGISVVQSPEVDGAKVVVETRLIHASGQWFGVSCGTTARRAIARENRAQHGGAAYEPADDPQSIGSAITYLRRYGLMAICGVAAETDDDDGNAGSPTPEEVAKVGAVPARRGKPAADAKAEPAADAKAEPATAAPAEPPAAEPKPAEPKLAEPAADKSAPTTGKRRQPAASTAEKPADKPADKPAETQVRPTADELRAAEQAAGVQHVQDARAALKISMSVQVAAIAGQSNAGDYLATLRRLAQATKS